MARADLLNILYSKNKSPLEFKFDSLWLPSLYNYLTIQDVKALYDIASSVKLSSKIELKYGMIDKIMIAKGFKRFHCGTNRVVYRYLEDQSFVVKVAIDRTGLGDNPAEFKNQWLLKPFVTKVFEVSPCGTVGTFERVQPITGRQEFEYMAGDIYDLLVNHIIGKHVLEDIGTKYFMNWGIRLGFGPVLLDFPYVFELDGNKMHCSAPLIHGQKYPVCDGEIDYDMGFNKLVCNKCGKSYFARDLEVNSSEKLIILKGDNNMINIKVRVLKGDQVVYEPERASDYIKKPELAVQNNPTKRNAEIKVKIVRGDQVVYDPNAPIVNSYNVGEFINKTENISGIIKIAGAEVEPGIVQSRSNFIKQISDQIDTAENSIESSLKGLATKHVEEIFKEETATVEIIVEPVDLTVLEGLKIGHHLDEVNPEDLANKFSNGNPNEAFHTVKAETPLEVYNRNKYINTQESSQGGFIKANRPASREENIDILNKY